MAYRFARLVPLRNAWRAVAMRLGPDVCHEPHLPGSEDQRIHGTQVACDTRPEAHVRDDVALGIEPWRDLDQFEPLGAHPEHRALSDEERELPCSSSHLRAVADLFQLRHELPMTAFPADHRPAALPGDVEVARGQCPAEYDGLCILADVDEA